MDLEHILLERVSRNYKYKGSGRGSFLRYERTRSQREIHGRKLTGLIGRAFPDEQVEGYISIEDPGVYLEIVSEEGYPLAIESLDTLYCRLCNVHNYPNGSQSVTVFIPDSSRHKFVALLERYKSQDGVRTNNKLFDNIASIRLAELKDFWTSNEESYPQDDRNVWWEIWLSRRSLERTEGNDFLKFCRERGLSVSQSKINFELYTVFAVKASKSILAESIVLISCLSELRSISDTASFILQMPPYEQSDWMKDLIERTEFNNQKNVSVLVLDQGINYNHPLLEGGVEANCCFAWDEAWPLYDRNFEHGTMQAGLIFYGDMADVLYSTNGITITYDIESCRIFSPRNDNEKELYGSLTYFAIHEAEDAIGVQNRVISLAITADHDGVTGQPTSWSSEIDQLSFHGNHQRLFVISGGNIRGDDISIDYASNVNNFSIEDPGQSWNALTIGAFTNKTEISDHTFRKWTALAEKGDICPTSRTSNEWGWKSEAPIKPDLVEEGGNRLLSPEGGQHTTADCVSLVTTADHTNGHVFREHGETSAATALTSRIVANVWDQYPDYWAETIRALVVHSASWSEKMLAYKEVALASGLQQKEAKEFMLRMFGHGVPSMQRAISSQNNYLTMIVQDEISPFKVEKGTLKFNEMHLVELPWPNDELLSLGNQEVKLRTTLSYFIEPNPGRRSYTARFSYQSYGLRFKLINAGEDPVEFIKRANIAEREDGFVAGQTDPAGWELKDQLRTRGTIHQDTWKGPASDLALRNYIAVVPVVGWWKQRKNKLFSSKLELKVPYSLVVSLEVAEDIDIYTPVAQQVGIDIPIEVEVTIDG